LQSIKELASCPELIEARAALKKGIMPETLGSGINGSYILRNRKKERIGIFKPREQEAGSKDNPSGYSDFDSEKRFGVTPGEGYLRERLAYLLDKKEHFSSVPMTKIAKIEKYHFSYSSKDDFCGSFQKWIPNAREADECVWGFNAKASEIQKIAILDVRTLNCDRHLGNLLVDSDLKMYPIDHGYTLPGKAKHLRFEWVDFETSKSPFTKESLEYIARLDPKEDARRIRKTMPNVAESTLKRLKVSTFLLQLAAAKGLSPYQIAKLMTKEAHFEKKIWPAVERKSDAQIKALLQAEIEAFRKK
jgi:hypothetical protein